MRVIIQVIVLLAGFLLLSPTSHADGNSLLNDCIEAEKPRGDSTTDYQHSAYCQGLVLGVLTTQKNMDGQWKTCAPSISTQQGVRIVLAYLRKNPARLHENQVFLVMDAFIDAYPCE